MLQKCVLQTAQQYSGSVLDLEAKNTGINLSYLIKLSNINHLHDTTNTKYEEFGILFF